MTLDVQYMENNRLVRTKIVSAHELDLATSSGWILIQVLPETEVYIPCRFEKTPTKQGPNGSLVPAEYETPPPMLLNTHRYLVAWAEGSVVAELKKSLEEEQVKHLGARNALHDASKEIETAGKAAAAQKRELDGALRDLADVEQSKKQLDADMKTMRDERAVLRAANEKCKRALGELQYKKLIESDDGPPA